MIARAQRNTKENNQLNQCFGWWPKFKASGPLDFVYCIHYFWFESFLCISVKNWLLFPEVSNCCSFLEASTYRGSLVWNCTNTNKTKRCYIFFSIIFTTHFTDLSFNFYLFGPFGHTKIKDLIWILLKSNDSQLKTHTIYNRIILLLNWMINEQSNPIHIRSYKYI